MYKYCDLDDSCISLHDCQAERMKFDHGVLSFFFPEGFWITGQHPQNKSEDIVRTDAAQVDFSIIDEEIDGIEISVFKENKRGTVNTWILYIVPVVLSYIMTIVSCEIFERGKFVLGRLLKRK